MTATRGRPRFTNWLAGLVAGTSSGLVILVFPLGGVLLIALAALAMLRERARLAGTSGLLLGVGAITVVLLLRAQLACQAFDTAPNQGCVAPDSTGYLAIGGVLVLAGLALSAVDISRAGRAPRAEPRGSPARSGPSDGPRPVSSP